MALIEAKTRANGTLAQGAALDRLGHPDGEAPAEKRTLPSRPRLSLPSIRTFVKRSAEEAGLDTERTSRIQLAVAEASAKPWITPRRRVISASGPGAPQ